MNELKDTFGALKLEPCERCQGHGFYRIGGDEIQCPDCKGQGYIIPFPKLYMAGNKIFEGETVYSQHTVDKMQAELAALRQQVDTLTAALEWYASELNWQEVFIEKDGGERARAALAAVKAAGGQGDKQP